MSFLDRFNPLRYLRLLDRYLFSEFLRTFLGTLLMLTGILMISLVMDNMKTFLASKESPYHAYMFLVYNIPRMAVLVVPPGLMFSVCFVVGQFNANKELVSMMAAGVSFYRTVAPLVLFGLLMWVLVLLTNETIVRTFNSYAAYEHSIIEKGVGTKKDLVYQLHIKGKEGFYYVYWYDPPKKMVKGGFNYIKINSRNLAEYILSAQSAKYNVGRKTWTLSTVQEIRFDDKMQVTSFKKIPEKEYHLPEDGDYFAKPRKTVEEMNFFDLGEEIKIRQGKGMPFSDLQVERHSIFAVPLMSLVVVIIGAIAGSFTKKSAGVASLGVTILVVLLYYIMYSTGRSLGEKGGIPPAVAVWFTPVLFFCASYWLYKKFNL
ncbi:MAG: LptF/LptG family permease [Spirochaetota bacterium]